MGRAGPSAISLQVPLGARERDFGPCAGLGGREILDTDLLPGATNKLNDVLPAGALQPLP